MLNNLINQLFLLDSPTKFIKMSYLDMWDFMGIIKFKIAGTLVVSVNRSSKKKPPIIEC